MNRLFEQVILYLSYIVAAAIGVGNVWQVFTHKTLPELLKDKGWWPKRATAQIPDGHLAAALAAQPSKPPTRLWNIVSIVVALALIGVVFSWQTARSSAVVTATKETAALRDQRDAALTDFNRATSQLGEANAEREGLRKRLDNVEARFIELVGEQKAAVEMAKAPGIPLGRVSLETVRGMEGVAYDHEVERRRSELRALSEETELGRSLAEMPGGTFAFVHPYNFCSSPFEQSSLARIKSDQNNVQRVEVQRTRAGQFQLILYVDEGALPAAGDLNGLSERTIDAFARPSERRNVLIVLPVERIVACQPREAGSRVGMDFTIR